jgi:hypothetical protein
MVEAVRDMLRMQNRTLFTFVNGEEKMVFHRQTMVDIFVPERFEIDTFYSGNPYHIYSPGLVLRISIGLDPLRTLPDDGGGVADFPDDGDALTDDFLCTALSSRSEPGSLS